MAHRWLTILLALGAATAFGISVQGGQWWTIGEVSIGPFGSQHCFGGKCRVSDLAWLGEPRWLRIGVATWAAGMLAMLVLVGVAATLASRRYPRLLGKLSLVCVATATVAGVAFLALFPEVPGSTAGRGVPLFAGAILGGAVTAVRLLRHRAPVP